MKLRARLLPSDLPTLPVSQRTWLVVALLVMLTTSYELYHYRTSILRLTSWDLSTWDYVLVVTTLVMKSVCMLCPLVVFGAIVQRFGQRQFAHLVVSLGAVAVLSYLALDVRIQAMTGQHLMYYLKRMVSHHAVQWAGDPSGWIAVLSVPVLAAGCITVVVAWLSRRRHQQPSTAESGSLIQVWGVPLLILCVMVAFLLVRTTADQPAALERLHASLPHQFLIFHPDAVTDEGRSAFGKPVIQHFAPLGQRLFELSRQTVTPVIEPIEGHTTVRPPDLLIVVLESFRYDALHPALMPNLYKRSQQGTVATNHSSSSNCSPQGSFALLFGMSALMYDAQLDSGHDVSWCHLARTLGFETRLSASCDFSYRRMEEMFGEPDFDEVCQFFESNEGWPKADRKTLQQAVDWLQRDESTVRRPQMVVTYLMSTHYDYPCDAVAAQADVAADAISSTSLSEAMGDQSRQLRTRYARSLHLIDRLLEHTLASIDLDHTIVIITGDHGESLFDDGFLSHGSRLSQIQHRTPMVVLGQSIPSTSIRSKTSHVDLLPTWLGRLGYRTTADNSEFHGVDWFRPQPAPVRPRLLVHEHPDTWDIGLQYEDDMLLLNVDRRDGATRVIGWVQKDGRIRGSSGSKLSVDDWVGRLEQAVDSLEVLGDSASQ